MNLVADIKKLPTFIREYQDRLNKTTLNELSKIINENESQGQTYSQSENFAPKKRSKGRSR